MLPNVKVAGGIFQVGFDWSPAVCKIVCRHRIQVRVISTVGTPSGNTVHMFSFRRLCGTRHRQAGRCGTERSRVQPTEGRKFGTDNKSHRRAKMFQILRYCSSVLVLQSVSSTATKRQRVSCVTLNAKKQKDLIRFKSKVVFFSKDDLRKSHSHEKEVNFTNKVELRRMAAVWIFYYDSSFFSGIFFFFFFFLPTWHIIKASNKWRGVRVGVGGGGAKMK